MSRIQLLIDKKRKDIPFKVALIYAFFSALWILFSDMILLNLIDDIKLLTSIQTMKGWFFILVTTLLIFNLLRREIYKVNKLEELMIQSEKMMTISHLALGMANEINNPLAGIVQNAQVVKNRLLSRKKANLDAAEIIGLDFNKLTEYVTKRNLEKIIDSIIESGRDASSIIDNLLSFTAQDNNERKIIKNIGTLLDKTIEIILKDNVYSHGEIIREYKNLPDIFCEPDKLQHAFFNIIINAFQSMIESGIDPKIQIKAVITDNRIRIEFIDAGPGMSDRVKGKIFEPFFTTRNGARGMGLAMSYFIISELHRGFIKVESIEGKTSNFII
ncbi:MAG: HAMP domain-containing sensor histidine kinase, partial [Spirochaetaceae bacterium]|nr:HAMP domain-containing sensor histidine kinase [Spirochaetaceae bacterium]